MFNKVTRLHKIPAIKLLIPVTFLVVILLVASHSSLIGNKAEAAGATGDVKGAATGGTSTTVNAEWSNTPIQPTEDEIKQAEAGQAKSNRDGPRFPIANAPATGDPGPGAVPQKVTKTESPEAAPWNAYKMFRNKTIPKTGIAGGYANSSNTMEPSVGANGKAVFQTGNWYASRSLDNGGTWSYANPFSIFGSWGFCCDQVTLYDKKRDIEWWLLQGNGLRLAWSRGTNLFTNWCVTSLDASNFGEPSNYEIDFNHMALGTNAIYVTTNLYQPNNGPFAAAGILRITIQDNFFPNCSGWSGWEWNDPNSFAVVPAQGFADTAYFGTDWTNLGNGDHFRLFSVAESSTTLLNYDRSIDAFAFQTRGTGDCSSADGVVTNWCQYADSRESNGYLSHSFVEHITFPTRAAEVEDVLGFYFDSNPCCGIGQPFVRRVYFAESDKSYLGYSNLWCTTCAIQYLDMEPNVDGHLGGAFSWGGGTGTSEFYPGTGYLLDDDISPDQPWAYDFRISGSGNTCAYKGLLRWGDYNTVRAYDPAGDAFVAGGWKMTANCGTSGAVAQPHNLTFGRGRDQGSYGRWNGK